MGINMTAPGRDELAVFAVLIPGHCAACNEDTDVVLKYHATNVVKALKAKGIDPARTPFLVLKPKSEIGVTCGCYARFQRQVAHIRRRGTEEGKSPKKG